MNVQAVLDIPIVDSDGKLSGPWRNFLSQFFGQMQQNFSDEGYKLPQQTTDNITMHLSTAQSIGALLYDKDTNEFKVCINGVFKTVQVL